MVILSMKSESAQEYLLDYTQLKEFYNEFTGKYELLIPLDDLDDKDVQEHP